MKHFIITLFTLVIAHKMLIGQKGQGASQQMSTFLFPNTQRTQFNIDCNNTPTLPNCNYLYNPFFTPNVTPYSYSNAFVLNQVPFWDASHGSPSLPTSFLGIPNPPPANNFALLTIGLDPFNQNSYTDEGIVQKISPLKQNSQYLLRFDDLVPNILTTTSGQSVGELNIYLISCADYKNFPLNATTTPPVPVGAQQIYCEKNIQATTYQDPINDWKKKAVRFSPTKDYDMIWVTIKKANYNNNLPIFYCVTNFQLFDIFDFNANVAYNACEATLSPNCIYWGAEYVWTAPNGATLVGANQVVSTNTTGMIGNWTLTVTFPTAQPLSGDCGKSFTSMTANVSVTNCVGTGCLNLPGIN